MVWRIISARYGFCAIVRRELCYHIP